MQIGNYLSREWDIDAPHKGRLMRNIYSVNRDGLNAMSLVLVLCVGFSSIAKTYYVAPNGNADNPGTEAQPWPHLQAARYKLEAGDSLLVRGGEYHINDDNFKFAAEGRRGKWVVISAYPGEKPVFNATEAGRAALEIKGSYIQVEGLHVSKSGNRGISFFPKSHHIICRNCLIDSSRSYAIYVWQACNVRIIGNTIRWAIYELNNGRGAEAIHVNGAVNFEIAWNEVLDGGNIGIDVLGLYRGRVHHNYTRNHFRDGIYIDSWSKMRDVEVYGNLLENDKLGIASEGGSGLRDLRIHHNVIDNGGITVPVHGHDGLKEDVSIYNTTCFDGGLNLKSPLIRNMFVFNNIFSKKFEIESGYESSNIVADHNYVGDSATFLGPYSGDFALAAGAGAIDSGRIGEDYLDLDGTRNDCGARYFHQGPEGLPAPPRLVDAMWWWNKSKVSVSWSAPEDGETSFVVERSTSDGPWREIARLEKAEQNAFEDSSVALDINYRYRVFSLSGETKSLSSKEVSIHTTSPAQSPTLRAESISDSKIKLSWTPGDGISEGYLLYRLRPWLEPIGEIDPDLSEMVVNNLDPDTVHSFVIASYNQADLSWSDTATAHTLPLDNPQAIWIEAESAQGQARFSPFVVEDDTGASNGSYIVVPLENRTWEYANKQPSEGICQYSFSMTKEFTIWFRHRIDGGGSNSFWLQVNDGDWKMITFNNQGWAWFRAENYFPEPGSNTLTIAQREAGTRIDKILVTDMLAYEPPDHKNNDILSDLASAREFAHSASLTIRQCNGRILLKGPSNAEYSMRIIKPNGRTVMQIAGREQQVFELPKTPGVYFLVAETAFGRGAVHRILRR